jgi:hypothetical protein
LISWVQVQFKQSMALFAVAGGGQSTGNSSAEFACLSSSLLCSILRLPAQDLASQALFPILDLVCLARTAFIPTVLDAIWRIALV